MPRWCSTTSSDSSASDPALEDGMSKLHEAVQNAAGAHDAEARSDGHFAGGRVAVLGAPLPTIRDTTRPRAALPPPKISAFPPAKGPII